MNANNHINSNHHKRNLPLPLQGKDAKKTKKQEKVKPNRDIVYDDDDALDDDEEALGKEVCTSQ